MAFDTFEDRLAALEDRVLGLRDLPLAALQRKLESDWLPSAPVLLGENSITEPMLVDGAVTSDAIADAAVGADQLAPVVSFEMYLNAAVAGHFPATAAVTKLPFDTLANDNSDGAASLANDNFTVAVAGIYVFSVSILVTTSLADGAATSLALHRGGAEIKRLAFEVRGAAGTHTLTGTVTLRCDVGDVIDARASIPGGTTKTAGAGEAFTYFHGTRISS